MNRTMRGLFLLGLCEFAVACGTGTESYQSLGGGGEAGASGMEDCGSTVTADFPWLHVDGNQIKNEDGDIVVLRGVSTIDVGSTDHYEGGLRAMIDRVTNRCDDQGNSPGWYPTVIRLAIYPADSADTDSPYTYQAGSDEFYETLLRPAVERVKERGAYAIVDWHYIGDTSAHRETTEDFWRTIAPKFANDPNVIFELFNEPVNRSGGWPSVKEDMQTWYDIVREAAPENLVLVGTPSWCQQLVETATSPLDGTNIAYVAHIYPMHFSWQSTLRGIETANAVHPVFLTEWGYEAGSNAIVDSDQANYGEPYKAWVEEQGMSTVAWCASATWYSRMFATDYALLVGADVMGGFAKDWMYEKRNENAPFPPN